MKLWAYKGIRIRKFHRQIKVITLFAIFLPFLVANGFYHYLNYAKAMDNPIYYGIISFSAFVFPLLLCLYLNAYFYQNTLIYNRLDNLRVASSYLYEGGYYYSKKGNNGKERIRYPKVYLKRDKFGLDLTFILQGNKFQDKFLNLSSSLEVMFDGDFMSKTFSKGFVTYTVILDHIEGRLQINDVKCDAHGLRLMSDVWWDFEKQPHLLIGGGTGGGKTVLLMAILKALLEVGYVDIGDPKKLDLSGLKSIPVFRNRVYSTKDDMIAMLLENADLVKERGEYMSNHPNFTIGQNYKFYGLKPKFVLFDEWAAFMSKLENDYQAERDVMQAVTSIVLEGRQAGVFIILAMQRPDGEFIKTALRDNFMKRISVGHLEDTGYTMMFGDANRNKVFKKIDFINGKRVFGRGYVANNGEIAQEFYSPFVSLDDGYSFIDEFSKMQPLEEEVLTLADNTNQGQIESRVEDVADDYDSFDPEEYIKEMEGEEMKKAPEGNLYMEELAHKVGQSGSKIRKLIKLIQEGNYRQFNQEKDGRYLFEESDVDYFKELYSRYDDFSGTWKELLEEEFVS